MRTFPNGICAIFLFVQFIMYVFMYTYVGHSINKVNFT